MGAEQLWREPNQNDTSQRKNKYDVSHSTIIELQTTNIMAAGNVGRQPLFQTNLDVRLPSVKLMKTKKLTVGLQLRGRTANFSNEELSEPEN